MYLAHFFIIFIEIFKCNFLFFGLNPDDLPEVWLILDDARVDLFQDVVDVEISPALSVGVGWLFLAQVKFIVVLHFTLAYGRGPLMYRLLAEEWPFLLSCWRFLQLSDFSLSLFSSLFLRLIFLDWDGSPKKLGTNIFGELVVVILKLRRHSVLLNLWFFFLKVQSWRIWRSTHPNIGCCPFQWYFGDFIYLFGLNVVFLLYIAYVVEISCLTDYALIQILKSQLMFRCLHLVQVAIIILELTSQPEGEPVDVRIEVLLNLLLSVLIFLILTKHSSINFLLSMKHHKRSKATQDLLHLLLLCAQFEK